MEEVAACGVGISFAGVLIVTEDLGVHEGVVNHVLCLTILELAVLEAHDAVSDQNPLEVDDSCLSPGVELINLDSQVRDVLACVGLAGNPKLVGEVLRVLLEEVLERVEVVLAGVVVVVLVGGVKVIRKSYSSRRLEKEQVGKVVPRELVPREVVSLLVVDTLLQVIRPNLLQET